MVRDVFVHQRDGPGHVVIVYLGGRGAGELPHVVADRLDGVTHTTASGAGPPEQLEVDGAAVGRYRPFDCRHGFVDGDVADTFPVASVEERESLVRQERVVDMGKPDADEGERLAIDLGDLMEVFVYPLRYGGDGALRRLRGEGCVNPNDSPARGGGYLQPPNRRLQQRHRPRRSLLDDRHRPRWPK